MSADVADDGIGRVCSAEPYEQIRPAPGLRRQPDRIESELVRVEGVPWFVPDGALLAGAEFNLLDTLNGTKALTGKTNADGVLRFEGVAPGVWRFKETATGSPIHDLAPDQNVVVTPGQAAKLAVVDPFKPPADAVGECGRPKHCAALRRTSPCRTSANSYAFDLAEEQRMPIAVGGGIVPRWCRGRARTLGACAFSSSPRTYLKSMRASTDSAACRSVSSSTNCNTSTRASRPGDHARLPLDGNRSANSSSQNSGPSSWRTRIARLPFGNAARATRTVSGGISLRPSGFIDIDTHPKQ